MLMLLDILHSSSGYAVKDGVFGFYDRDGIPCNDLSKIRTSYSNCRESSAIMLCDRRTRMLHYNKGDRKELSSSHSILIGLGGRGGLTDSFLGHG